MSDKNSDDDELLDAVFIAILDKERIDSVCSRLKINVNLYNSCKNRILEHLGDMISFYDNSFTDSFTDFLDYVLNISDRESHLSDLDVKIKELEQELKELAKEKKQKTEDLNEIKKQLSEIEEWLKYKENQQTTIANQMAKIIKFESTLRKYNLTLDDFMKLQDSVIPATLQFKNQIDVEIGKAQATYQRLNAKISWLPTLLDNYLHDKEKLESEIRSKKEELSKVTSEINKYLAMKEGLLRDIDDLSNTKERLLKDIKNLRPQQL